MAICRPASHICILEVLVVEHLEATVRHKSLWHSDSFRSLVVLYYGSHNTRQSQSRTIQSVTEFRLLCFLIAIATLQTVCLIAFEVTYRRNLKPFLLCRAPYLKVIAYR